MSGIIRKLEIWSLGNEWWLKYLPIVIVYGALLTITLLLQMVSMFFMFVTVTFVVWLLKKIADKAK